MASSQASSTTLHGTPPLGDEQSLSLRCLPPVFVSQTHFDLEDLHELEEKLVEHEAVLTYDITEARIVLSRAERKRRVVFDLQSAGLWTEEVVSEVKLPAADDSIDDTRAAKRLKVRDTTSSKVTDNVVVIDDSATESEGESKTTRTTVSRMGGPVKKPNPPNAPGSDTIKVVKLNWFEDSVAAAKMLPLQDYLTYEGRPIAKPADPPKTPPPSAPASLPSSAHKQKSSPAALKTILERAKADAPKDRTATASYRPHGPQKFGHAPVASSGHTYDAGIKDSQHAHLLQQTSSEYDQGFSSDIPEMPAWVKQHVKYACERCTLADPPNDALISLLKQIKLARLLTNDEIGVRAYSTSIASLAAYEHKISNPREILALPGCDVKIANLYIEYSNTGRLKAADDAENSDELTVLRLFYEIWGVGATTAREFYYERGWRDLDDIVEFGWNTLSRVQQIGVKYYDEFLSGIPRDEVKTIADIIHRHAVKVRDADVQSLVVGGYRRGKEICGDVDIIVSHPIEEKTAGLVTDIVASLEDEGWITHTLLLSLTSTNRGQQTLPYRTGGGGHGFDTLDKALVVWQDPEFDGQSTTSTAGAGGDAKVKANGKTKRNPNVHRRVDIIITPWRTVGCAVAGWSGGTTFQRDVRRYAKNVKGWKFDSSGIRDRTSGMVVDVEGYEIGPGTGSRELGRATTMVEAERRVFEGLGLTWREPWERCTG